MNWWAVGFSLPPPLWRCFPKKLSRGSWEKRSLSRNLTPGRLRRKRPISTNDFTVRGKGIIAIIKCPYSAYIPEINKVSRLKHILAWSAADVFGLEAIDCCHSDK